MKVGFRDSTTRLTEYHGKLGVVVDEHVQHFVRDLLNLIGIDLIDQPLQDCRKQKSLFLNPKLCNYLLFLR